MPGLVLFDLDGTLVDTAQDLVAAVNHLRTNAGLQPMPFSRLRDFSGKGARGLIREALQIEKEDSRYPALEKEFLRHYRENSTAHSNLFDGIKELITQLSSRGHTWGIVTNKAYELALPIVTEFFAGLPSPKVLIGGDTAGKRKPAPDGLLLAMKNTGFTPQNTIYVGDDIRDIQAAKAACCTAVAANWGYTGGDAAVRTWEADFVAQTPPDVLLATARFFR